MLLNIEHNQVSENRQVIESNQVTEGDQVIEDKKVTKDEQVMEDEQVTEENDFSEYEEIIRDEAFEITYLDVQNPLQHIGKGRPAKMRIKSATEKNKKIKLASNNLHHTSHHCCSVYKNKGHDKRNCPNK
ncbi:12297_t:CDS:1 [Dentiscutata erythropus]|uniref:12297_t:CDS:1 n=1 Tax=Dentiscutata erythropus TaxID=1348616 RepID=A0A9N9J368_9GLOM|nr:12297_t:CDS:1 [Dentiscutata erythropus]